jgi:predicted  nucleic acid-binding Zn-ribbon protein
MDGLVLGGVTPTDGSNHTDMERQIKELMDEVEEERRKREALQRALLDHQRRTDDAIQKLQAEVEGLRGGVVRGSEKRRRSPATDGESRKRQKACEDVDLH